MLRLLRAPNPSLQPTRSGLRPPRAAKLNRWAFRERPLVAVS
jgi:hypothetical protein